MTSARRVAREVLERVEQGAYANALLPEALRRTRLADRDRAFATDLVYGTVRMQRAVDHLLASVSSRPLEVLDPSVRAALRLGAYQLMKGVPPHAAVGETVTVAPARAGGFVNAVLRALARIGPPWPWPDGDDPDAIGVRTSHPDWIVETLMAELGAQDALRMLDSDNSSPSVTLRVNPRRTTVEALTAELEGSGAHVGRGALVEDALVVRGIGDPRALPAVRHGRATPQDQGSQAVVAVLGPEPGERVLDVAAAPGGKATAAAELMDDRGLVVAVDLHPGRARLVRDAGERTGLRCVRPVVADGRSLPVAGDAFDRVLVDAPCSGLGVLRRRPDARWRVQPGDVRDLAALQLELLAAAALAVRPGGRLVYAVCTLTRAETLDVDSWAVEHLPGFVAVAPPGPPWRSHARGALILPHDAGTDGMFVLALERKI